MAPNRARSGSPSFSVNVSLSANHRRCAVAAAMKGNNLFRHPSQFQPPCPTDRHLCLRLRVAVIVNVNVTGTSPGLYMFARPSPQFPRVLSAPVVGPPNPQCAVHTRHRPSGISSWFKNKATWM